jgi:NAD(P)-dependent dehydrogenase (short-subunit alcohol dehydrogenase family)
MAATARITTSFGFESTAAEVVEGIDLSGKRAIVTGGSSGIGVETARALAGAGADVTLNFEDCNEALVVDPAVFGEGDSGVADYALDPENAERLWVESFRLLS